MAKLKSKSALVLSLQHNTRERLPPNADPQRTAQNWTFGGTTLETLNRFDALCPGKVRANAVMAVELVFTASPDFKGDWDGYLKAADQWAMNLFGAENLLHCAHHLDESTPHAHVLVVPKKDGKLNANFFIGGSRDRMAELQNDFFEKVGKRFELDRGQSKAETRAVHSHHTLAAKTAELDRREENIKLREKVLSEFEKQHDEFSRIVKLEKKLTTAVRAVAALVFRGEEKKVRDRIIGAYGEAYLKAQFDQQLAEVRAEARQKQQQKGQSFSR